MRFGLSPVFFLPVLLLLMAFAIACESTISPDAGAVTGVQSTPAPTQTITPLTDAERAALGEFAQQLEAIDDEWDRIHEEFDTWRAGLTECHVSSVQQALRIFAADSNSVTEQARDIPRTTVTSEMADMLIEAAAAEETSFRQLRDRWQPTNISLFELVEQQRSASSRAQLKVEDLALELHERYAEAYTEEEVEAAEELEAAFDELRDSWRQLHEDYRDLRGEHDTLDGATLVHRYGHLAEQSARIVAGAADLPTAEVTEDLVESLLDAANEEQSTLLQLVSGLTTLVYGTSDSNGDQAQSASNSRAESDGISDGQATQAAAANSGAEVNLAALLDATDAAFDESKEAQRRVARTIDEIVEGDLAKKLAEVESFQSYYEKLVMEWDGFLQKYDEWRSTEGGCDRVAVAESLSRFNLRFGELGRKVRDLPQSGLLLPMYALMVQAVDGEEVAMRTLYNAWRPFTVDAFRAADSERMNSDRLRRQAGIALQELRERP